MNTIDYIGLAGLVPVVVIEDASSAVKTAEALLAGGLDIMEITLRTDAGLPAIKAVSEACPDMAVGAGTVLSVEQAKSAVDAGAAFIVSPGFNPDVVDWCLENDISVTPGCVTPTEIETALKRELSILKFFPANVYGGVSGCKALSGPYGSIKFIPTGGVGLNNLADFANKEFIHAVGGGWLCPAADIKAGNFDKISETVRRSIDILLGFEPVHTGINSNNDSESEKTSDLFKKAFNFEIKTGNSSRFAGAGIEINKAMGIGDMGHIAIKTNSIGRAVHYLQKRGFNVDSDTEKLSGGKPVAVYLKEQIGGFGIHLLQG